MKYLICMLLAASAAVAAEKVEILRDNFGVAHIFAKTAEGAAFASGYAQAEDRLEELMRNLRKSDGTMAEAFGEEWYRHDYLQRMWGHRRIAEEKYKTLQPKTRAIIEAYVRGINRYIEENPAKLPAWGSKVTPAQIVGYSRFTIWSWHQGDAAADLRRGGIEPDPIMYRGSNQMLVAPSRTQANAPLAVVDPHLSWYGETRYWETRVYGGEMAYSGGARVGLPFPTLGHSFHVSVAMTTGGPDTGDVFEETVKNGKYLFRGEWKPLTIVKETIAVKGGKPREVAIEYTHHGPIWAHKDGKAYSMATPYHSEIGLIEQAWQMTTAKNLAEMKKALANLQYMAQNIMVSTVDGDIYYLRNGRVPVRKAGCDHTRPMRGDGECEWLGVHKLQDLVQLENPPQGYMQNNNTSPVNMLKDSPLTPEQWESQPWLYNDSRRPPSQRAAMTRDQLDAARNLTIEDMVKIAFSTEVYKAGLWQERIRKASDSEFAKLLLGWDRRSEPDSRAALAFYLFKMALGDRQLSAAAEPPDPLTNDQISKALVEAERRLKSEFPAGATYGTYFRVGREGSPRHWPVGGGNVAEAGMSTPRNITFQKRGDLMIGVGGQTQTQIIQLMKPVPRSYMILPLGQSDDPKSPHFDDQAEKLFSKGIAKDTYFGRRQDLEKVVESRKELVF